MPADSSTPEPTVLPTAPPEPSPIAMPAAFQALPRPALQLLRLSMGASIAVVFVAVALGDMGLRYGADVELPWPPLVPAVVIGILGLVAGLWWTGRSYRAWRYSLSPDRLRVEHGVITTRSAVLPRSRVQHVSTERGPLQRWLGLVTLTVHTAGANTPNVSIPHLMDADADAIRQELIDGRS